MNNSESNKDNEKQSKKLKNKVDNRNIVILVLLVIIIILLLRSCSSGGFFSFNSVVKPQIEDAAYVEQEITPIKKQSKGKTDIPVIQDFTVSKTSPYQSLYNPESNTGNSYLKYIFSFAETEEVFYESDLVKPAYKFSVPFGDMLEIGEHDVMVEVVIIDFDTYVTHSSTKTQITITVSE